MQIVRRVLFWCHLTAGVAAGLIVLVMSATGVLLTYEKQVIDWADTYTYRLGAGAPPLGPEALLAEVSAKAGATPASLTLRSDPTAPASVTFPLDRGPGERLMFVDPYTGRLLGEGSRLTHRVFQVVTDWHRWLGATGPGRTWARSVTGAANLLFLFAVLSGLYLWVPRTVTWVQIRQVLWFRRGLRPKARDFNWHNVVGFWLCIPLFVLALSGVVISYPWASDLVFRAAGEAPPAGGPRPGAGGRPAGARTRPAGAPDAYAGLDALADRAARQNDRWRTISLRLPHPDDTTVTFAIDAGYGGDPRKRETLTLDRRTAAVVAADDFRHGTTGRRWRTFLRFAHTGEFFGLAGQTLAGAASLGACLLVYTGFTLSWRRYSRWHARRALA